MEIRKLISKFITQLCEKNYSKANETLQHVVEAKVKEKIKKSLPKEKISKKKPSQKVPSWSAKKVNNSAFGEKGIKGNFSKKVSKKGNK